MLPQVSKAKVRELVLTCRSPAVIAYMSMELTCASTRATRRGRCLPKIRMFLFTATFGGAAAFCITVWLVQVSQFVIRFLRRTIGCGNHL